VTAPTLTQLLDDAAFLSFEHQLHLADVVGNHSWEVDLTGPRFAFTGDNPLVCEKVHLLGSAAPGPGSWLWSWANPTGFNPEVTGLAEHVRGFGEQHGIKELASGEVPFDVLPGAPSDPSQIAAIFLEAAKAISGRFTAYTGDAGGGTRVAFLIEHPAFHLPPPEGPRVMRVIQQCLAELPTLTDHRRALHSYATRRGLGAQFSQDGTQSRLNGTGFQATVQFDQQGRVGNINASMGQSQA
jgi:uncharacterized protein DUF6882